MQFLLESPHFKPERRIALLIISPEIIIGRARESSTKHQNCTFEGEGGGCDGARPGNKEPMKFKSIREIR